MLWRGLAGRLIFKRSFSTLILLKARPVAFGKAIKPFQLGQTGKSVFNTRKSLCFWPVVDSSFSSVSLKCGEVAWREAFEDCVVCVCVCVICPGAWGQEWAFLCLPAPASVGEQVHKAFFNSPSRSREMKRARWWLTDLSPKTPLLRTWHLLTLGEAFSIFRLWDLAH